MKRAPLCLALLLACSSPPPKDSVVPPPNDPAMLVAQFYATLMVDSVRGAPTTSELAKLAPLISDTLHRLLAGARSLLEADLARDPGSKPSFAEGDLFSSLFEGPVEVATAVDSAALPAQHILARLSYRDGKDTVRWTDTAIVTQVGGHRVIDDIRYGGTWDFGNKGSLRQTLVEALTSSGARQP